MREVARVAAALVAVAVVARDFAVAGDSNAMRAVTFLLAFVLVGALALGSDGIVTASGLALVGHYATSLWLGHVEVDLAAPAVGALVVLYLDLADLAMSLPPDRRVDRAFAWAVSRRAGLVLGTGTLAATGVLLVASVAVPHPSLVRAAGLTGVALAVAGPVLALRRQ